MWSAATVLVCVLDLLGRSATTLPPIVLVDTRPLDVTGRAEAFVRAGNPTIFLLTSSTVFEEARTSREKCGGFHALRKLASIVVHEEWHVRHGADERGAYEAQLITLMRMGAGPGNPVYTDVKRSMRASLNRQARRPPSRRGPAPPSPGLRTEAADVLASILPRGPLIPAFVVP